MKGGKTRWKREIDAPPSFYLFHCCSHDSHFSLPFPYLLPSALRVEEEEKSHSPSHSLSHGDQEGKGSGREKGRKEPLLFRLDISAKEERGGLFLTSSERKHGSLLLHSLFSFLPALLLSPYAVCKAGIYTRKLTFPRQAEHCSSSAEGAAYLFRLGRRGKDRVRKWRINHEMEKGSTTTYREGEGFPSAYA